MNDFDFGSKCQQIIVAHEDNRRHSFHLNTLLEPHDMYNGIGLQTARGSGTNGYVQSNLANLLLSKKRVAYNSEADIKRAEAEINRKPNNELLEHNRKRHIELKCADFEMLMENKGFDETEIQNKVSEYRKLLQSQVASGELDIDAEMDSRDTHVRAKAAIENRNRMRSALGIKDDFVDGTSFEKLNKNIDLEVDEAEKHASKRKKKRSSNNCIILCSYRGAGVLILVQAVDIKPMWYSEECAWLEV
ncbi:unnamed protein product [Litomosoides sigmodontis]|uniref:CWF21 domain-containing protein n=1 Tax=Litomosoides sigmodontis TaxID=42156 RepID=A0A3P6V0Y5_LITSI|nr:unnamed protein product [Litomosoides sigmodontis]